MKSSQHINIISKELLGSVSVTADSLHNEDGAKAFMEVMDTYGFAVVTDVLTADQASIAESLFDDDLFSIVDLPDAEKRKQTCFQGDSPLPFAKRWDSGLFPLGRYNTAFASDYGIPQGRCAWYCRMNPEVHHVFEVLHGGCKELCVGMDNVFFDNAREDHTVPDAERQDGLWPHADQSIHADGGKDSCFQSILYIWPSSEHTSTTVVWPSSHKGVYEKMMSERAISMHFCPLPGKDYPAFAEGAVRVIVPRGGMIIWNSKLIHQGWNNGPRLAVPICMEPKERRRPEAFERKLVACKEGIPTTHWASLGYFHGCCKEERGGTDAFPLHFNAHTWMIDAAGSLDRSIQTLL
jgi:hypothetical protein